MFIWRKNNIKRFASPDYNYSFNYDTGLFCRWGKDINDDPPFSPFGLELLDLEVSNICHRNCEFCYKQGYRTNKNMSFETFKIILDKMPSTLTQVAFGVGSLEANEELWQMMKYCREKRIVPNITINADDMTPELYDNLAKYCGAVSVSKYDKDICYNAVKELTDRGLNQCNIHCLLCEENYIDCYTTLLDRLVDPRLKDLNAVVFLWLKEKGERNKLHQLSSMNKFKDLISIAMKVGCKFGFDSCTAPNFLKAVQDDKNFNLYKTMSESCESSLFSYYINVDGIGFPCSFSEGLVEGIDVLNCNDFVKDVWYHPITVEFRNKLLNSKDCNGCSQCQIYNLDMLR